MFHVTQSNLDEGPVEDPLLPLSGSDEDASQTSSGISAD